MDSATTLDEIDIALLTALVEHPRAGDLELSRQTTVARATFKGQPARAMFAGMAGHSMLELDKPFTAAAALLLGTLGHAVGWPFVRGGSRQPVNHFGG